MILSRRNTEMIKYEVRSEGVRRNKIVPESWEGAKQQIRVEDKSKHS